MAIISSKDAFALSFLARHKGVGSSRANEIKVGLKGEALQVAKALTGKRTNKRALISAKALRQWAANNDQIALNVANRSRT